MKDPTSGLFCCSFANPSDSSDAVLERLSSQEQALRCAIEDNERSAPHFICQVQASELLMNKRIIIHTASLEYAW